MNDIIKIIKSSEDSGVSIHGVTEKLKTKGRISRSFVSIFIRFISTTSNFFTLKGISRTEVRRVQRG